MNAALDPSIPVGGMTGICHNRSAAISEAAARPVEMPRSQLGPAVPELRKRFGLDLHQSDEATSAANPARARVA